MKRLILSFEKREKNKNENKPTATGIICFLGNDKAKVEFESAKAEIWKLKPNDTLLVLSNI